MYYHGHQKSVVNIAKLDNEEKVCQDFFFLVKFEVIDCEIAQQMNVIATQTILSEFSSKIHREGKWRNLISQSCLLRSRSPQCGTYRNTRTHTFGILY